MPRMGVTHQRVVTEAATVADEAGLDGLTLAAVAEARGHLPSRPVQAHRQPRLA